MGREQGWERVLHKSHSLYQIYLCRGQRAEAALWQGQVEELLLRVKVHPCDWAKGILGNILCPCSPLKSCFCHSSPLASLAPLTPGGGGSCTQQKAAHCYFAGLCFFMGQ